MIKRINSKERIIGWLKERILNERLDIIFNLSHFLVLIYILDGMILKRNKFVIQWRNFELKRDYIFKVIDFWIFLIFPDFIEFFWVLLPLKMQKKRFFYLHRTPELMWHVGPMRIRHGTQGHVAAPRGSTRGGDADTWQDHGSPRRRSRGGGRGGGRGLHVASEGW